MGSVWLADDESLGAQVAIKQIEMPAGTGDSAGSGSGGEGSDGSGDLSPIRRARREALHATKLRGHPHVATVLDVVQHEGLPWIVMEYVSGATDLAKVIRDEPRLPDAEICRIGVAVLKALEAGHAHGILHRDVKPANILLASDHAGNRHARVMLTDYGISLEADSSQTRMTQTGVIGTPGFTAPERMRDQERRESDLFSLGAALYCASEGHGPFDRGSAMASFSASLLEPAQTPANAGPELRALLLGLLEKDPDQRTDTGSAMTRLSRVAEGSAVDDVTFAIRGSGTGGGGRAVPGFGPAHTPVPGQGFGPAPDDSQDPSSGPSSAPGTPRPSSAPGAPGPSSLPGTPGTPGAQVPADAPVAAHPAQGTAGMDGAPAGGSAEREGKPAYMVALSATGRGLWKAWRWLCDLSLWGKLLLLLAMVALAFLASFLDHMESGGGPLGAGRGPQVISSVHPDADAAYADAGSRAPWTAASAR
ncbi:serine/threonine protein kinase [Streptomyces reniochalinae]|uniref:non-specific serine/threonine protein kinase n=2 Tax=Streptomyces reniochalinae TaxID=2250578 RepID=A0A367EYM7_9ACTN|nr:serine/threonine protein kinase [Streptomyces reniochalinae]